MLSPRDYDLLQADIIGSCHMGTGQWFLKSAVFAAWVDGRSCTLFCPGIPGVGKTFMMALVVSYLRAKFPNSVAGVAVLYCSYKMREEQNVQNLLAGLLRQLAKKEHILSRYAKGLTEQWQQQKRLPSFTEVTGLLRNVMGTYTTTFIVIDAPDECESVTCSKLLDELLDLQRQLPSIRLLVTCRPQPLIENIFEDATKLEIRASEADLESFLDAELPRLSKHVERDSKLKEAVIEEIIKAADGM
jgi:Cdc6-like AAA superfamily ATPase